MGLLYSKPLRRHATDLSKSTEAILDPLGLHQEGRNKTENSTRWAYFTQNPLEDMPQIYLIQQMLFWTHWACSLKEETTPKIAQNGLALLKTH